MYMYLLMIIIIQRSELGILIFLLYMYMYMYLNPIVSAERDLLQYLYVHNISSSVLHLEDVSVRDEAGLGSTQYTAPSVVHCRNGLTGDAKTLVHTKRGREIFPW